jgi:hypothetical protein
LAIKLKRNKWLKYKYAIYDKNVEIGEIEFKKYKNILVISFIGFFDEYKNKGYGLQTVSYLLKHYKIDAILGETLNSATGFWNKCIKRFNGKRHNICYSDNCSSSFVIPNINISNDKIYELLEDINNNII